MTAMDDGPLTRVNVDAVARAVVAEHTRRRRCRHCTPIGCSVELVADPGRPADSQPPTAGRTVRP